MKLFGYWRSSASYRCRIALNLKGCSYAYQPVHLVKDGGEQHSGEYRVLNPQGRVPTLVVDGVALQQSLAIIEYLDETVEGELLLPKAPLPRARARAMAQLVACDIQPLQNLSVLQHLVGKHGCSDAQKKSWCVEWITRGFVALEALLEHDSAQRGDTSLFCVGDTPTIADICLVPQVYNARRFAIEIGQFPRLQAIDERCRKLKAFADAAPEVQPDAPTS